MMQYLESLGTSWDHVGSPKKWWCSIFKKGMLLSREANTDVLFIRGQPLREAPQSWVRGPWFGWFGAIPQGEDTHPQLKLNGEGRHLRITRIRGILAFWAGKGDHWDCSSGPEASTLFRAAAVFDRGLFFRFF
jgi:hypothetical protein